MICNNIYLTDILRVCEIKDLILVMRYQSHLVYSTTKETHQLLFKAIMVKKLRNQNIVYTIFFNNQLCIKLLNIVTVLLKPVHVVRQ